MNISEFLLELENRDWKIDKSIVDKSTVKIDEQVKCKLDKAPQEFIDFICSFSDCINSKETEWFLSYAQYIDRKDIDFQYNTFELESLDYADFDPNLINLIQSFWNIHIPFLISLESGYAYVAICIEGDNYGKIYSGIEPEYEDATYIADNISEFFIKYLSPDFYF